MCLSIAIKRPDDVLAEGEHAGFKWMVIHNGSGYRCGYVRVPLGHPWHGAEYELDARVHGGITFAEADVPCDQPGEDTDWWVGFDCAHGGDAPDPTLYMYAGLHPMLDFWRTSCQVRTQEYVENECKRLCEQAKEAV